MSWSPMPRIRARQTARGMPHVLSKSPSHPTHFLPGNISPSAQLPWPPERSMTEMKLEDLKLKSPTEMLSFAEENGVENASTMRKQELMFATLKQLAAKDIEITGTGVVEVLQDGFGFL